MPFTNVTPQVPVGPYPALPVAPAGLDLAFVTLDAANGNSFVVTGKEILVIWNPDVSGHTVTIASAPDALGRTGDIATYTVGAGVISAFLINNVNGWKQTDGTVHITGNSALLKVAILRYQ